MDDVRGFKALVALVQAWHEDNCHLVSCPCDDGTGRVAEDNARVIHRQIIDDYEETES